MTDVAKGSDFGGKARWGTTCCRLAGPPADTGMGSDQVYLITYTLIIYAILEEVVTKHKDRFNTTCIARHTLPPVTCEFLVRLARLSPRRACPYSFRPSPTATDISQSKTSNVDHLPQGEGYRL